MRSCSKQINLRQRVFIALTIIWMITIFCFSAEPGDESSNLSGGLSYRLISIVDDVFSMHWNEAEKLDRVEVISFPIRKAAHMSEYAMLGILVFAAATPTGRGQGQNDCRNHEEKKKHGQKRTSSEGRTKIMLSCKGYIIAISTVFIYACTDEFHQLFVPGRSGQFTDVLIDTAGGLIGLVCILILTACRKDKAQV